MTHIEFECPFCSRQMKVHASAGGKSGKCKSCKNTVIVPKRKAGTEAPVISNATTSKRRTRIVFLTLIAASVATFATGVYVYWNGTTTEQYSEEDGNTLVFRTDTKSIRTGLVVHTRITVFSKSQPEMSAIAEGDIDQSGNRHGKWKYVDELDFATHRWFWHGRECSEEDFNSQASD